MNEIFPKVNPTPGDEKKMEQVLYKAKEILADAVADDREKRVNIEKGNKNFPKLDSTPEDEEKMESILNEAREILACAEEDDEKRKREQALEEFNFIDGKYAEDFWEDNKPSKEELQEIGNTIKRIEKELKDESSDFYTNTEKGSVSELFFKTLAEEIPSLDISIDENAVDMNGVLLSNYVAVRTVPYKTDREFIWDLYHNETIHTLVSPEYSSQEDIKELEKSGVIPKDFHHRALVKQYEFYAKKWPDSADFWKGEIAELGDVIPFSNEEIQEIMRKIILDEFKKRLNGD